MRPTPGVNSQRDFRTRPTFVEFGRYLIRKRPTLLRLLRTFSFVREASGLDPGTWTWFGPKCDFRTRPTFDGYVCGQV